MKSPKLSFLLILIYTLHTGCSILKKEDPEIGVRNFLVSLQSDLKKSDEEVLKFFRVSQSREAVLTAINVLRNVDPFVVCDLMLANSLITPESVDIRVEIPITFRIQDLDTQDSLSYWISMKLTQIDKGFVISQFNGEDFYKAFIKIKNRNIWEVEQKLALREREYAYEAARQLEESYDSVIWYTTYAAQNYFYVVNGGWVNTFHRSEKYKVAVPDTTRMGLVNEKGEIIVPIAFDLIGTISFVQDKLVEVKRDGKIGYFDIGTKQLVVDTVYNLIVPYRKDSIWAIVKHDSTFGWLDKQYVYTTGFPSTQVEKWFNDFSYLKENIQLKAGNQVFCEIPDPEYAGKGIIIPPSYLVSSGIFNDIEGHFSTSGKYADDARYDYKETRGSFITQMTENLRAVVVTIRERYLEGREEFYTSSSLKFINEEQEITSSTSVNGDGVRLSMVDSLLIEVRSGSNTWFDFIDASSEYNLQDHTYFTISPEGKIEQLNSRRLFPQTQFVKIDCNYLSGAFKVYDYSSRQARNTNFLSAKTITYMRDEILADYGYGFPDDDDRSEHFKYTLQHYQPKFSSIEEFESDLTEIDQHNLLFLNRILELLKESDPNLVSS